MIGRVVFFGGWQEIFPSTAGNLLVYFLFCAYKCLFFSFHSIFLIVDYDYFYVEFSFVHLLIFQPLQLSFFWLVPEGSSMKYEKTFCQINKLDIINTLYYYPTYIFSHTPKIINEITSKKKLPEAGVFSYCVVDGNRGEYLTEKQQQTHFDNKTINSPLYPMLFVA